MPSARNVAGAISCKGWSNIDGTGQRPCVQIHGGESLPESIYHEILDLTLSLEVHEAERIAQDLLDQVARIRETKSGI